MLGTFCVLKKQFPPEFPFTMVEEEWPESQATGSAPADAPESAPIVESVPATVVEPATEPTPLTELEPAESEPAESEEETEDASSTRTFETQRSTPYTRHFDTHLASFGIRPSNSSQEPDLEAVREALAPDRASLLPSQFSIGSFKMFRETNDWAQCDADVVANVLPHILGFDVIAHENSAQNLVFSNLAPLTDGTIAHAKPDVYYGADPDEVHDTVCDALGRYIDPSAVFDAPLAPNFFVEVKAPLGSWGVVKRQARYDGAIGCRAMHSLQNFGANNSRPRFDSRPTAFSAIYRNGGLHLFAHHVTAPDDSDRNGGTAAGRPQYHMTPLLAYALTDSPETFTDGVEAFRNLRDYAKQLRDQAIQAANFAAARDGPAFKDETEDKTGRTIEYEFEGELEEQTNETRKLMEEGSGDQPALSTSETNTALDNLLT